MYEMIQIESIDDKNVCMDKGTAVEKKEIAYRLTLYRPDNGKIIKTEMVRSHVCDILKLVDSFLYTSKLNMLKEAEKKSTVKI